MSSAIHEGLRYKQRINKQPGKPGTQHKSIDPTRFDARRSGQQLIPESGHD